MKGRLEVAAARSDATVGTVNFRGKSDAFRELPETGRSAEIELALEVTNRGDHPLRLKLLDTIRFRLIASDGRTIPYQFARDSTSREGRRSPSIAPGQSFVVSRPARLERRPDDSLRLSGPDGFGGLWWFEGLRPGTYSLNFEIDGDIHDESPRRQGPILISAMSLSIR